MSSLPHPVTVVLPWSCLVSDNDRMGVWRGRKILTRRYRNALAQARLEIARQWRGPRWGWRVAVTARIVAPPGHRDVQNFTKLLCDALEHSALRNDEQVADWRIVDGGRDDEFPRAELDLIPMERGWRPGPTTFVDQWGRPVPLPALGRTGTLSDSVEAP